MMMMKEKENDDRRGESQRPDWFKACGDWESPVTGWSLMIRIIIIDIIMMMITMMMIIIIDDHDDCRQWQTELAWWVSYNDDCTLPVTMMMIAMTLVMIMILRTLSWFWRYYHDYSIRPLSNGIFSKASWPTQILARWRQSLPFASQSPTAWYECYIFTNPDKLAIFFQQNGFSLKINITYKGGEVEGQ